MRKALSNRLIVVVIAALLMMSMVLTSCEEQVDKPSRVGNPAKVRLVSGMTKVVALTFDDGPDPRYTPEVLDILRREGVKATFFMVGANVDKYPDVARQVKEQGHQIENHTYSHPLLEQLSKDQVKQEITKCQDTILRVTGAKTHYFRPPKGRFDSQTVEATQETGYKIVMWNMTVEHKASRTAANEAKRIVRLTRPEYIVLAHDGLLKRGKTVQALPSLIEGLKARGYRFVTVDALAQTSPALPDKPRGKSVSF